MNKIFPKIYGWLFIGLLISFLTGYYVSTNQVMLYNFTKNYYILAIVEIVVVIWLSAGIRKMSSITAKTLYALYSVLTGLTLSSIFVIFQMGSIIMVFGITSLIFAIMAIVGHLTNIDLTKLGSILFMGLLGIVITSIINLFLGLQSVDFIIIIVGIIIFTLYIAYDIQKVKYVAETLEEEKAAIICAFELYLDFINLFIKLIRLLGKRKD